ncbi:MAG: AAA family ATPase [Helicobacteraceae bacterium]|jgi:DNA repair protein RecN (Recombination protein N)|nr:AAA family ATPase [Helicobacteraceae bacterium]
MIARVSIKDALGFKSVVLEPHIGLNVFSGPSGAGKSILMNAMLSLFGLQDGDAASAEAVITGFKPPKGAPIEIDDDEIVIRLIKKDKVRYFINDAQIGKSALKSLFENAARRLNQKETSDISSNNMLSLLDLIVNDAKTQSEFAQAYERLKTKTAELAKLQNRESRAQESRQFALFELEKIEAIAPKEGEYERLLELKKRLSKKEKIGEILQKTRDFKEAEGDAYALYDALGLDRAVFEEGMSDLESAIETARSSLEEIDALDPETMLDRIEKISGLIRRYGGVKEALAYAEEKRKEIESFESLEADAKRLTIEVKELDASANALAKLIQRERIRALGTLEDKINDYLRRLRMPSVKLELSETELDENVGQKAAAALNGATIDKISGGELNRLRLALLAARVELGGAKKRSMLFMDEIDANVSGEESASVANVLQFLAARYQIFAISHQSQLTSKADAHFLVSKTNGESRVAPLDRNGRVAEIARIISADQITDAALRHAEALLNDKA